MILTTGVNKLSVIQIFSAVLGVVFFRSTCSGYHVDGFSTVGRASFIQKRSCTNLNTSSRYVLTPKTTKTSLCMSSVEEQLDRLPPRKLVQLGMQYFKQGDVNGSIQIFDRAEKMEASIKPYLWQRGISYYYADRFQEGSDQFRYDVKVNPLDVEEIVWDIACQYMANQNNDEMLNKMSLPKGKTDRRKIMVCVLCN